MPIVLEARIFRIHKSLAMVLPAPIVKELGLKVGDTLIVTQTNGTIVLHRKSK